MKRDAGTVGTDVLVALRDDFPDGASAQTLAEWLGMTNAAARGALIRLRTRLLVKHVRPGLWRAA